MCFVHPIGFIVVARNSQQKIVRDMAPRCVEFGSDSKNYPYRVATLDAEEMKDFVDCIFAVDYLNE